MNKMLILGLKAARKICLKISANHSFDYTSELAQYTGQKASDLIKEKLGGESSVMVCRFGNVELNALLNYHFIKEDKSLPKKIVNYVNGNSFPFWWDEAVFKVMSNNAGFINANERSVEMFCKLMEQDIKCVDILGTWMNGERFFDHLMPDAVKVPLIDLEPYNHIAPWSEVLEGKTVLVIHPYETSIQKQYLKRENLFVDKRVLPKFRLKTIKAVQSIANNETSFEDWFAALDHMKNQIDNTEFDIAIIGCGAYGFPLAAHVKRLGKKAVHLGGSTQILFGIKGKRWEGSKVAEHFNEFWQGPNQEEKPKNFSKIEDGCYW